MDVPLLVLVLDLFPSLSNSVGAKGTLDSATLIFINAHLALRFDGRVAVVAAVAGVGSHLILDSASLNIQDDEGKATGGMFKLFKQVDDVLVRRVSALLDKADLDNPRNYTKPSCLASALSIALSFVNRVKRFHKDPTSTIQARILTLSVSPDSPTEYISLMNCIFAAKKDNVIIDVCRLLGNDSVFLSQTASSTDGVYVKVSDIDNLITVLLHSFLPEPAIRKTLCLPGGGQTNFSASCFCHKKACSIAFVCSVCLSIFCSRRETCSTCGSSLSIQSQQA
ncbi:TFIIH subunit Tfb4/p34 [Obelidium mucronatum]|nr:TFIIH subunit Tfb4/p34 [Obelidium mucronatum]